VSLVADAFGVLRLTAAALLPQALLDAFADSHRGALPLVLFAVAATTDFFDGPVARRGTPTRHGAVLDNVADVAFVLAGTATAAWAGRLSATVPLAIAAAVVAYARASAGLSRRRRAVGLARSRIGHAAGIANYALVAGVAGAAAWPAVPWRPLLVAASVVVVGLNLTAALGHFVPSWPSRVATPAQ
jgi:phosphatidylglycerophosphate synthase